MYFHLCFWKWWIGHNPMSFVVARAMVKSWIAYWLPRSEVGEVAPFLLSHVVFPRSSAADLQVCLPITDHLPMSLLYNLCPFWLEVDFDETFGGCVEWSCRWIRLLYLVNDHFRGLCLAMGRRLHDTTDRYRLRAAPNQWSYAVSGYRFHFGDLFGSLDLCWHPWSSHGVWAMPAPKCSSLDLTDWDMPSICFAEAFWVVSCHSLFAWLAVSCWDDCCCLLRCQLCLGWSSDVWCHVDSLGMDTWLGWGWSLPSRLVVQADMLEFSWAHLTGDTVYKVGVCSPPCPPWSKAAVVPRGFRRRDGALAPLAVALLPLVGCKTSALENLSGLLQHDHWHVVNVWIASWNLTSRGPRFLTWLML